ncbi:O-antigen/teichoic acid export membrane protein [Aeromicrobium sp. SORGH_AS981]|uniref:lipopolysaccharide biosynthesis protein n=1 Tax=Aeromicrobium sp. SORGH_AS_0981 TaxID=3041802 RepID=UPI0028666BA2|nr:hypothetical protein [Aeromicrobium sp. SORGH_AS_0981]MDR6117564.1 O-antigen/teichoic acid export membrane protein [Aeromicrobium sp. SORGH_AS_0981]
MNVGLPMLVQLLTPPITTQVTRLIVAQTVSVTALAEYGVLMQILIPAMGLVSAVGITLWPYYSGARGEGRDVRGPFQLSALFLAAATVGVFGWVAVAPWLFDAMTGGTVEPSRAVVLCFGLQMAAQAALYPLGMYLMSPRGIRFQVVPAVLVCVSSLALVTFFAPSLGIVSVPLSVALSTLIFQIVPFGAFILKEKKNG